MGPCTVAGRTSLGAISVFGRTDQRSQLPLWPGNHGIVIEKQHDSRLSHGRHLRGGGPGRAGFAAIGWRIASTGPANPPERDADLKLAAQSIHDMRRMSSSKTTRSSKQANRRPSNRWTHMRLFISIFACLLLLIASDGAIAADDNCFWTTGDTASAGMGILSKWGFLRRHVTLRKRLPHGLPVAARIR